MNKVSENIEDNTFNINTSTSSFSNNDSNKSDNYENVNSKDDEFKQFMNDIMNNNYDNSHNKNNIKHKKESLMKRKSRNVRISKLILEGKLDQAICNSLSEETQGNNEEYDNHLNVGTSDEEIYRITSKIFANSYEVLNIPINSDELLISKKYKKLSLLIHPDKTKNEKANEAFDILNKAYQELQKAENRLKYKNVWKRAHELVKKEIKKNKKLSLTKKEFDSMVIEMSEKLIKDLQEKKEYSEKCLIANYKFEQELNRIKLQEENERCLKRKKWNELLEERAMGWRCYKQNNSKLFK